METLFKRYFWTVNLALLTAAAWLAAGIVNNLIEERIVTLAPVAATADGPPPIESARIDRASKRALAQAVIARDLFDPDPPEPVPVEPEAAEPETPPEPPAIPGPFDDCKDADVDVELLGTMVADPEEWSVAVVKEGRRDERLVKEGDPLSDAVVTAIYRQRMVLARGGEYECVRLGEDKRRRRVKRRSPRVRHKARAAIRRGVKKIGRYRYQVDREMLDEQLSDLYKLGRQVRVRPYKRRGKPYGLKLLRVRYGSLFREIGLRRNDIITRVNGEEIARSPNEALALFDKLEGAEDLVVEVERRGRKITLEYDIE